MLPILRGALGAARTAAVVFAVACYSYMCLAVMAQVLGRYLLHFRIAEFAETATYAQVWLGLIGAGVAMRFGTIFAIDALPAKLPVRLQRPLAVFIAAISILFLGIVLHGSLIMIEHGFGQRSSTLLIPMWIIYLPMPVGLAYFALEVVMRVVEHWDRPFYQADVEDAP